MRSAHNRAEAAYVLELTLRNTQQYSSGQFSGRARFGIDSEQTSRWRE
jgi:hypothetical protein